MSDNQGAHDATRGKLLSTLASGAAKTFRNADSLFREASVLRQSRFLSRALSLHQISLEECGKIEILGEYATALLMGDGFDPRKLAKAIRSHEAKNRANAYLLRASEEERRAWERGDFKGANRIFFEMQRKFHSDSNEAKNASLYVDFNGGTFVAPDEIVTEEMVAAIAELNMDRLTSSSVNLRLLERMETSPERFCDMLSGFNERANKLKCSRADPREALKSLLGELRDRMLE